MIFVWTKVFRHQRIPVDVDVDEQTILSNIIMVESVANIVLVGEVVNSEKFQENHANETIRVEANVTEEE